jgi:hypothetical protein
MASDSTFKETESSSDEPEDEASPRPTPNPMRPPRPAKRKASGRIPLPVPFNRTSLEDTDAADSDFGSDAAPVVGFEDERDEPAIPLMAARAKPSSVRPEESFADLDADLFDRAPPAPISDRAPPAPVDKRTRNAPIDRAPAATGSDHAPPAPFSDRAPPAPASFSDHAPPAPFSDRAPAAPVTPRRAAARDAADATPPRPIPFASLRAERDDEPEPTIVGRVPDNLLELSGGGDETRAFTAPRELIELAKRKREERRESKAPKEMHGSVTERPPAPEEPEAQGAPAVLAESGPPRAVEAADEDAAPPVARTVSGEMEAVALPSRRRIESEPPESEPSEFDAPEGSGPVIEIEPPSELSDRAGPGASAQRRGPASAPLSSSKAAASSRRFWLWVAVFVLVGITIARWRDIALLLHR